MTLVREFTFYLWQRSVEGCTFCVIEYARAAWPD